MQTGMTEQECNIAQQAVGNKPAAIKYESLPCTTATSVKLERCLPGAAAEYFNPSRSYLGKELPRSCVDLPSTLEFTPSFAAVFSSKTPVAGRLFFF
jgi:hypothetical protein